MTIRIPAPLQDAARTAAIKRWVDSRGFLRNEYFRAIESFEATLAAFDPDGDVAPDFLVAQLTPVIDTEGSLLAHILDIGVEVKDEDTWHKYLQAAAWLILQRYTKEKSNGKWSS